MSGLAVTHATPRLAGTRCAKARRALSVPSGRRQRLAGLTLVELMVSLAISLLVLAALVALFANSSNARRELDRSAVLHETGRYAMGFLREDLMHAGYYGPLTNIAGTLDVPCSSDVTDTAPHPARPTDTPSSKPSSISAATPTRRALAPTRRVPPWPRTPSASNCLTAPAGTLFSDLPDGEFVEKGGAGQRLRQIDPTQRPLFTCAPGGDCGNLVPFTSGATTVPTTALSAPLVDWVRGMNVGDGPAAAGVYETYGMADSAMRPTAHGDVVHSRPLAVNYNTGDVDDVVVFYGGGDGVLRAINGNQTGASAGRELWGFVAPEHFSTLGRLRENTPLIFSPGFVAPGAQRKDYFFDGAIGAYQVRTAAGTVQRLYLYPTMRRGGRMVYGLDATSRPNPAIASTLPSIMWRFGCPSADTTGDAGCMGSTEAAYMGQSWSTPRIIRLRGSDTVYVAFGGGYDGCEDADTCPTGTRTKGQGVYVLNAATGVQAAYLDLWALSNDAGRVVADVVPVDVNGDGYTDVLYTVDTRGNIWRTNTSDPTAEVPYTGEVPSAWQARTVRIARVSDWASADWQQRRKLQYAPDAIVLGGTVLLFAGTGDREQPLDGSNATRVQNRFYSIRDQYANLTPTLLDGLNCDTAGDTILDAGCPLLNVTDLSLDYETALQSPSVRGWVFDLVSAQAPYEQVVTTPVTAGGIVYFSTFQASGTVDPSLPLQCSNLGVARGYAVDFLTGGLRRGDNTREAEFLGGGIPPSPVAGVVEIDGSRVPFILGGRPSASRTSAIEGARVPIDVLPTRRKIYRFQRIDR